MPLPWSAYALARTAGLLGVAAFAGSAVTNAVASRLLVSDDALAAVESVEPLALAQTADGGDERDPADAKAEARERQLEAALAAQAEAEAREGLEQIVDNNIFCLACQPIPTSEGEAAPEQGPAVVPTELPLALLATMESSDPSDSMATIRDTERRATGVYGVGDPIRPGVVIAGIQQGVVVLRSQVGGMQTLGFSEPEQPKPKQAKQKKPKNKRKRSSREIPGAREAIDCKGNACTVDREFVEKLMANPRQLAKQAKIIPAVKDGQTRGFRVYRVRSGTLPKLLGLRNGDTLLSVNGTELDSMDQAIALYTKLRRASELSLTVERKGKVFEKQISIR